MKAEEKQWADVLSSIEKKISKPSFDTWLKSTKLVREGNKWIVLAPNAFAKEWLETRYYSMIKDTIHSITNEQPDLSFSEGKTADQEIYSVNKVKNIWSQILSLCIEEKEELLNLLQNEIQVGTSSTNIDNGTTIISNHPVGNVKVDSKNQFEASKEESQQVERAVNISQRQNEDDLERIEKLELEVRELRSVLQELSKKVDLL